MITLIGHPESKRTFYFCQAASRLQEHINVVNYDQALTLPLNKGMVKIDPPLHQETDIRLINTVSQNYISFLHKMATRRKSVLLTRQKVLFIFWISATVSND